MCVTDGWVLRSLCWPCLLDALSMHRPTRVQRTVAGCFAVLHQLQTICSIVRLPVSRRCSCTVTARLEKCYFGRPVRQPTQSSPVCSERRSSVDRWSSALVSSPTLFRYLLSPVRLSVVCLSSVVYNVRAVQIFRNISTALGTLAIR